MKEFFLILGTCVFLNGSTYRCLCPTVWTDQNCGTPVNPCASLPCRNNGQCFALGNQALCICLPGFNGTLCDNPINPCGSNPCKYLNKFLFDFSNSSPSSS
jgi:hypothetical protein